MTSICVFCGSSIGTSDAYREAAQQMGEVLARRDITLVYGGGRVGLMGTLADAALAAGGKVIGVIPQMLRRREVAHASLTELRVVDTLAERKAVMGELSDAFITLPGGLGTLDELFEVWTWSQLKLKETPCGLLNVAGYYDPLLTFLDDSVRAGFVRQDSRELLKISDNAEQLVAQLLLS
jgi:uncharacterized protein (TIGR00730 family)